MCKGAMPMLSFLETERSGDVVVVVIILGGGYYAIERLSVEESE